MGSYKSTKVIDGFSTCFRQWRAKSHCSKLHGYSLKFKVTFTSDNLDLNNWVADFGFMKTEIHKGLTFKKWFEYMFDHTTIVANDDPDIVLMTELSERKVIDFRNIEKVGCEAFAFFVYSFLSANLHKISENPSLSIFSVECMENEKNSAIYEG